MKQEIAAQQVNVHADEESESPEGSQQSPLDIHRVQVSRYPQSMDQTIDHDQRDKVQDHTSQSGYCVDDTEQSEQENLASHRTANKPTIDMHTLGIGIATPHKLGLHQSKESINSTSHYERTVQRSHHQNVQTLDQHEGMIYMQEDEEEDPLPRNQSPLKAQQDNTQATTPTITPTIIPARALKTPKGAVRATEQE